MDRIIDKAYRGKLLSEKEINSLCLKAQEILADEANIVVVRAPVIICGDVRGQFLDLLELFQVGGKVPESSYLFLGNYLSRGIRQSVQTLTLLIALKIRYPGRVTLLRGKYEGRVMSQHIRFYDECYGKYVNANIWTSFITLFDYLPLTAVIQAQIFCLHGGLSQSLLKLDKISSLNRFQQIPDEGPICELMWNQPGDREGWLQRCRSAGLNYGPDITRQFTQFNNFQMIVSAMQTCRGYEKVYNNNKVTVVFSAPAINYDDHAVMLDLGENLEQTLLYLDSAPRKENRQVKKRVPIFFMMIDQQ